MLLVTETWSSLDVLLLLYCMSASEEPLELQNEEFCDSSLTFPSLVLIHLSVLLRLRKFI